MSDEEKIELKKYNTIQLLNFCLGFFGLQFAWQMRIILSAPVTEGLGASPFIFGLIWLAGPITGMVVQPIIGAMSDNTVTKFGRRIPYLFLGALFGAIALWAFPNSKAIVTYLGGENLPIWSALLFAAIMIWVIDACVNAAQGPYRALIPDNIPSEQHALANSYLSFAIGLGSVIAAGAAPFLKWAFNYQMSINAQFVMAALAFLLAMTWTCLTIKEVKRKVNQEVCANIPRKSFADNFKEFLSSSPEVYKICAMQFFTWIGIMSMFIFFTNYSIHILHNVPDLASADNALKAAYSAANLEGSNFSSIAFALFNLICFIVAIPIGKFASKFGNKGVHIFALLITAIAFALMTFTKDKTSVLILMAISGIGWASILALPFAMLSEYIKKGSEGSIMGIFNIFIAGPQVLVCTILAWFISKCPMMSDGLLNYHWEYALMAGAITLFIAALITFFIKEKRNA